MEGLWVELVFMMVILKIPVVYLCAVVWWAIRAEPRGLEGAATTARGPASDPGADPVACPWSRRRPRRPRVGPGRRASARRARVAA